MRLSHYITIFCIAIFSITAIGAEPDVAESSSVNIGGITLGIHANDERVRSMADAIIPAWQSDTGIMFINPRFSFNDNDEEEFNFGFGWRELVADKRLIVGANLFYDSRWSMANNRFEQVGFGIEVLSDWVDLRANYYVPDDSVETIKSDETTSISESRQTYNGTPYISGVNILQDRTTIIDRTTTTILRREYEAALEGFDVEVGVRLPVLVDVATTRLFIGYQSYDNPFGPDFDGWKGRGEMRFGEGLILDIEVFENEELNMADFYAGVRLRLPFSIGNLIDGKNPFEGSSEVFKTKPQVLESRLTEMVMRDMNIRMSGAASVTQTGSTKTTRKKETVDIGSVPVPPPPNYPEEKPEEEEPPPEEVPEPIIPRD